MATSVRIAALVLCACVAVVVADASWVGEGPLESTAVEGAVTPLDYRELWDSRSHGATELVDIGAEPEEDTGRQEADKPAEKQEGASTESAKTEGPAGTETKGAEVDAEKDASGGNSDVDSTAESTANKAPDSDPEITKLRKEATSQAMSVLGVLKAKKDLISEQLSRTQRERDARNAANEVAKKGKEAAARKAEKGLNTNPLAAVENAEAQRAIQLQQTALSQKLPDTTPLMNDIMSVTNSAVKSATRSLNDQSSNVTVFDTTDVSTSPGAEQAKTSAAASLAISTARKAVNDANIEADTIMKKAEMFSKNLKLVAGKAAKAEIAVVDKDKKEAKADLAKASAKEAEALKMEEATASARSKAVNLAKKLEARATATSELDHEKTKELQAHVESNKELKSELQKHGDLLQKYEAVVKMQRSAVNGNKLSDEDKAKLSSFVSSLVSANKESLEIKAEALEKQEKAVESMPPGPEKEEKEKLLEEKESAIEADEAKEAKTSSKDFDIEPTPKESAPDESAPKESPPESGDQISPETEKADIKDAVKGAVKDKDAEISVLKTELKAAENKYFNKDVEKLEHKPEGDEAKVKDLTKEPGTVVAQKSMDEISKLSPAEQQAHADKLEMQNREHTALLEKYEESKKAVASKGEDSGADAEPPAVENDYEY